MPRWLDQLSAGGAWTWACQNEGDDGPGLLAFWRREHAIGKQQPEVADAEEDPYVSKLTAWKGTA